MTICPTMKINGCGVKLALRDASLTKGKTRDGTLEVPSAPKKTPLSHWHLLCPSAPSPGLAAMACLYQHVQKEALNPFSAL